MTVYKKAIERNVDGVRPYNVGPWQLGQMAFDRITVLACTE